MSTYVRGASNKVFPSIQDAFEQAGGASDTLSLVIKIINRSLKPEAGLLNFE
ncbi:MAG: hypothetical protein HKN09_11565 [Saprospiraceae bacterium]|nr:hypothetical protein [Saprospiraceae bacterium]